MLSMGTRLSEDVLQVVPPYPYSPMVISTDGRTLVSPIPMFGAETAVIVTIGQSLMANYVGGAKLNGGSSVLQVNLFDGAIYVAQDPLLGVDTFTPDPNSNSNFAIRLAQKVIASGKYTRVLLLPIAVGGTMVSLWQAGGVFNNRIVAAAYRLRARGIIATAIAWQQGTTDNTASTTQAAYAASLQSVIDTFRQVGFTTTPFFVAQDTWYNGTVSAPVRAAQAGIVNPAANVFAGPDIDLITDRRDVAHMTATGADQQATAWAASILPVISP